MSNPLRIASIKKQPSTEDVKILSEVLKAKWKARDKADAEKWIKLKTKTN